MNRRSLVRPFIAIGGAVLLTGGAVLVVSVFVLTRTDAAELVGGPPLGAVLSEQDRRDLDAADVSRGAAPPPVDPAVDLRDPSAVARAYLAAANGLTAADSGHTQLRAAGYAVPGSPPATVGVLVLDPPPAGSVRTAQVRTLELLTTDRGDRRRGYRAAVETATGPPESPAAVHLITCYVVLARQPNGQWLVAADTPESEQEIP